jgi:hypothetical protein
MFSLGASHILPLPSQCAADSSRQCLQGLGLFQPILHEAESMAEPKGLVGVPSTIFLPMGFLWDAALRCQDWSREKVV